jgi:hypothetical protein
MISEIIGSVDPSCSLMRLIVLFLGLLWAAITSHVMAKQATKPAGRSADDTRNSVAVKYVSKIPIFMFCKHRSVVPHSLLHSQVTQGKTPKEAKALAKAPCSEA